MLLGQPLELSWEITQGAAEHCQTRGTQTQSHADPQLESKVMAKVGKGDDSNEPDLAFLAQAPPW